MWIRFGLLAMFLALSARAGATDPPTAPPPSLPSAPPTPAQAADEVLAAASLPDPKTLAVLAARDEPDPWLVADELLDRERHDEAAAFAAAAPRIDVEALPTYVAGQRAKPDGQADDDARRARLARANTALGAKEPATALEAVLPLDVEPAHDVIGLRLARAQALALAGLARWEEAAAAHTLVAQGAERLGWIRRASGAWYEAGEAALHGSRLETARAAWGKNLEMAERRGDRRGAARATGNLASLEYALGDRQSGLALMQRVLEMMESLDDKIGIARAVANLGAASFALGAYDTALGHFERAWALADELGDSSLAARALSDQAAVHSTRGEQARALSLQERALALQEALGDRRGAATTLGNLGVTFLRTGEIDRALAALEKALAAHKVLGDQAGIAASLGRIGEVHVARGEFAEGLPMLQRALAASERLGDRQATANVLQSLGSAQFHVGALTEALALQERSLALCDALGDRLGTARALSNIGEVQFRRGDHADAMISIERARAAFERLGHRQGIAAALTDMGNIHRTLGDPTRAIVFHTQAMESRKAMGDKRGAANSLGSIGNAYADLREPEPAFLAFAQALETLEALGATSDAAGIRASIGVLHFRLGDFDLALAAMERSLVAHETMGDMGGVALALANMGAVQHARGDYPAALAYYQRALRAREDAGEQAGAAITLGNVALAHLRGGAPRQAILAARRAAELAMVVVAGLGAEEGAGARDPYALVYEVGAEAAAALSDVGEASWFFEAGRAGALLEGLDARESLASVTIPPELREAEAQARSAMAAAAADLGRARQGMDRLRITAARRAKDAAEEELSGIVARIQRESKAAANLVYPELATLDEIRAVLREGEVLVLFAEFNEQIAALLVAQAGARLVALGPLAPIQAAVGGLAVHKPGADPSTALRGLTDLLVAPLRLPSSTTRVLVSPTGLLSDIPFAALVPDKTISYVPSGTVYRLLRKEESLRGEGVLALGDPDYSAGVRALPPGAASARKQPLSPLPATRAEAQAVGTLTLLGSGATEAGLREALASQPRWRAVHLACHGLVDADRPVRSSLAITASGEDDGLLTCLDVFSMRIPADLVVLSACETARGKVHRAEGIVGLTRAFMFAGSPRVLCSLWKVDDDATAALMRKFYELWSPGSGTQGSSAAEALREAQAFIRTQERWKHPYYWAAWVLWGLPE